MLRDGSQRPPVRRRVLVRIDGATHELLTWLVGRRLSYSIGFSLPESFATTLPLTPAQAWTPAYNSNGQTRDGAWVAEVTDLLELSGWPQGMRVIIRKERPRPGAQPRLTETGAHRDDIGPTVTLTHHNQ